MEGGSLVPLGTIGHQAMVGGGLVTCPTTIPVGTHPKSLLWSSWWLGGIRQALNTMIFRPYLSSPRCRES